MFAYRAVESELGKSGRVLLRASGTEPVIRVMVEAETEAEAQKLLDVSNAFGTVIKNPVLEVLRVDENLISAE